MWNIVRKNQHSISPPLPFLGRQLSVPNFKKGSEKNECLGVGEAYCVSCQKRQKDCKIHYGFEDSISNVDLSSAAQPPINV